MRSTECSNGAVSVLKAPAKAGCPQRKPALTGLPLHTARLPGGVFPAGSGRFFLPEF